MDQADQMTIHSTKKPRVNMIVVAGKNRAIGKMNELLWYLPADLKHFKKLTMGHPVIMGRKTFESILSYLNKPFPGRTNIVISRNPDFIYEGVVVADSLNDAITKACARDAEEIFITGGAQVYNLALPIVDRLYLTLVEDSPEADSYIDDYSDFKNVIEESATQEENGTKYTWLTLERS